MKEIELKPCGDIEKLKEQANHYIDRIFVGSSGFQRHEQITQPIVFMSRDVFNVLMAGTETALCVSRKFCTICGCKVEIINGTEKLYIGYDLLQ